MRLRANTAELRAEIADLIKRQLETQPEATAAQLAEDIANQLLTGLLAYEVEQ